MTVYISMGSHYAPLPSLGLIERASTAVLSAVLQSCLWQLRPCLYEKATPSERMAKNERGKERNRVNTVPSIARQACHPPPTNSMSRVSSPIAGGQSSSAMIYGRRSGVSTEVETRLVAHI